MSTISGAGERHLVVVSAGLGRPSTTRLLADRIAAATTRHLAGAGVDADVTVIELRDNAHDITTQLLRGFAGPELAELIELLSSADGAVAVSPVFNGSYSGLFESFFDLVEVPAGFDPSGLGAAARRAAAGAPSHSGAAPAADADADADARESVPA